MGRKKPRVVRMVALGERRRGIAKPRAERMVAKERVVRMVALGERRRGIAKPRAERMVADG